jgi:hypothetical protein
MMMLNSLHLSKIWQSQCKELFVLVATFKIQNGGEIQDGRKTIKCCQFVKNYANNLLLFLEFDLIKLLQDIIRIDLT